jgi:hypothetical protein
MRTEIVVLHTAHAPGSGATAGVAPQFQFQFHVHCDDDDGVIELVPVELSEQFQFQFHTQVVGVEEETVPAGSAVLD